MATLYEISLLTDADFDALMDSFEAFEDFEVFTVDAPVGEPTEDALVAIASRPLEVFTPSTIDRYGRAVDTLDPRFMTDEA